MTYQNKATQISLLLHAALVLGGLLLSRCVTSVTPPLVIDFSIATAEASTGISSRPPGAGQQQPAASLAQTQSVASTKTSPKTAFNQPPKQHKKPGTSQSTKVAKEKAKKTIPPQQQAMEPTPAPMVAEHREELGPTLPTGASPVNPTATSGLETPAGTGNSGQAGAASGERAEGETGGGGGRTRYTFEYIRRLILNNLRFPAPARKMGLTGTIVVSFLLKEDGQVENIAIVSGSGHEILDNSVITTIRRIAPFPKPPARAQLVLPIVFHLQ
jgi:protein TonB